MSQRAAFDDVNELRVQSLGVLGGEGSEHLEKVKTELGPDGIHSTCTCGTCSKPNVISIGYDEAVVGSLRLLPPGWQADAETQTLYPNVGCAGCKYQLQLRFTPVELKRLCEAAVAEGHVPGPTLSAIAAPYLQQQQRQQPRR